MPDNREIMKGKNLDKKQRRLAGVQVYKVYTCPSKPAGQDQGSHR